MPPLMVLELVLEIGAPREARWRCLSTSDGASWLDCASHFDVTSFDVNILAPFGADSRISRTARRMAHDLLCAALLLLGCLRPARAARLAIAALGICRASYLGLLLDAASSFSSTAATAQQFSGNRVVAGSAMRHQLMSRNSQRSPGNAYSVCRGLLS